MDYGLEGKVALVTGAASGIGKATAELLARNGARVVGADVKGGGGVIAADVADGDAMRAVVAQAVDAHGRLDLAANCAGVGGGHGATHEYPEADFDRIVAINLRGTWLSMRAEIAAMLKNGGGAIVNVSSTLGLRGSPFAAPYSASKHAVLGLTRTAALEYAQQGIRVNAVCPGAIDTPMMDETFERFPGFRETLTAYVPMGRMGGPDEVAGAIGWLCSDAASFVTGEALTVEGGLLSR
jgi:NAD(P)-dependent dehydrogenase (short-subunit alcohol dehydrogenase family)